MDLYHQSRRTRTVVDTLLINYLVYHQVWPEKQNSKCGNCRNISIWRQLLPLQSCHSQLHSENFNSTAKSIARNQISKTYYWWIEMGRFVKWGWKPIKKSQYQSLSLQPNQYPTYILLLTKEVHVRQYFDLAFAGHVPLYCSPDPTTNSGTMNPDFHELFDQLKVKLHKQSKMGSKQSIHNATQYYFFQKTVFGAKKSSKKIIEKNRTFCWFLNFLS